MSGGHRRILTSALAALTVITTTGATPVQAANAGFHLTKTVSGATITPVLSLTLAVDKSTAIPGDTLKYSGNVTNTADSWVISGQFTAESHLDSDATIASYWDEVQYCQTGCGNGLNVHWTTLAGAAAAQTGYTPATPPDLATGLTLTTVPDTILGSTIAAGASAIWTYKASIALTPAQVALLSDPSQVAAIRNVAHFEAQPRNANAAQPWTDSAAVTNGFQSATGAGNATNAAVTVSLPDGTPATLTSTMVAGLAAIAPGAQVAWSTTYKVPAAAPKAAATDAAYLASLLQLDGSTLTATASVTAMGSSGAVTATAPGPATTTEQLPILGITKTGPSQVDAGSNETNPLTLTNRGHADAAAVSVVDTVPGGATGTVSLSPTTLAAGKAESGSALFPVPDSQPAGNLTDTASVTWQDANGNAYGPLSSSWQTTVNSSLAGAKLTLAPPSAGPDVAGTQQAFTATLIDKAGKPLPGKTVTLNITGANPASLTATTDAGGNAGFSYTGANKGTDQVQAVFTSGSFTLQSNTVSVTWIVPIVPVSTSLVNARFYHGGCGSFCANVSQPPVFTEQIPTLDLNPPYGTIPHNPTGIGVETRPMYEVTTDVAGNFTGAIVMQGTDSNGVLHQAGIGDMGGFDAVFTGSYTVAAAGDVTFNFFSDDGFIFGVAGGATRVSGSNGNPPSSGLTPLQGYPVMGAYNFPTAPVANNITVHFPAAGSYPYEVDYSECCGGQIAITMAENGTGLPPTGNLSLTPFAPPANTVGKTQTLAVAAMDANGTPLSGIGVTLNVSGANQQQLTATTGSNGVAGFSYQAAAAGVDHLQGSAMVSGVPELSNSVDLTWNPAPPAPSISGASLADGALVTKPVAITATITPPGGQTIALSSVSYQAVAGGAPVTLPSTATPVSGSSAVNISATFDPTVLTNGAYVVTISATASGGGVQTLPITLSVIGHLKPGREVQVFRDMSVPVTGLPVEVRRSYDSFDKSQGDFGVGWRVQVSDFQVAPNRNLGAGGWTQYNSYCVLGLCLTAFRNSAPRYVTVTWPDGHDEIFDFTPTGGTNVFYGGAPAFTARANTGTTSTLTDASCGSLGYTGDGNLYGCDGQPYNPQQFLLTARDGRVFKLDRSAGLISMTDRAGNRLTVSPTGIQSSAGPGIVFSRDGAGRIVSLTGPSGESVAYGYDAQGNLANVTTADRALTTYTYDADHNLLTETGPGATPLLQMSYDTSGRLTSITDGNGNTVQVAANVPGLTQTLVDPAGTQTTVTIFDDFGDVVRIDRSAGGTTQTQTMTYDATGHVLTVTDARGGSTTATYDAAGDMTSLTDPAGNTSQYSYDSFGNVTAVTGPGGAPLAAITYDASGNIVSLADGAGAGTAYGYASGRIISRTDPNGAVTTYTYTSAGQLASATQAGGTTTFTSDASGRTTSVTDANGHTSSMSYDADGNLLTQTDGLGRTRSWTYDAFDRPISTTDAAGNKTTYAYDAGGRLVAISDPTGSTVSRGYDADGRLVSASAPDGSSASFAYDAFGRMTTATTAAATLTFGYDPANHLLSQTSGGGQPAVTLNWAYDPDGRPISATGPDGSLSYRYDGLSELTSLTDAGGHAFTFNYDAAQRLIGLLRPDGVSDSNTYDANGRLLSRTSIAGSTTLASNSYSYAAAGEQATRIDPANTATYSYDAVAQLLGANNSLSSLANETYTYDAAGGRSSSGGNSYSYDAAGRLVRAGSTTYTYDATGRRASMTDGSGHVTSYTWNAFHQLTGVRLPDGSTETYRYDALGRRVEVDHGASVTHYVFDGQNLRLQYEGSALAASYVFAPETATPLEVNQGGATYYYLADRQGSMVGLADQSGALVATQRYDSFGNPIASTGTVVGRLSYLGQQYDASTGLYYFNARYYDPATGSFISPDPLPNLNRYSYALNDPVDLSDVSGADGPEEEAIILAKDIEAVDQFGEPVTEWAVQGTLRQTVGAIIRAAPDPLAAGGDDAFALKFLLSFIASQIAKGLTVGVVLKVGFAALIFAIIVFVLVCASIHPDVSTGSPGSPKGTPVIRAPKSDTGPCSNNPDLP